MISEKARIAMQGWEMAIFSSFVNGGRLVPTCGKTGGGGKYRGAYEAGVFGVAGVAFPRGAL
jgi:hypothetical protein